MPPRVERKAVINIKPEDLILRCEWNDCNEIFSCIDTFMQHVGMHLTHHLSNISPHEQMLEPGNNNDRLIAFSPVSNYCVLTLHGGTYLTKFIDVSKQKFKPFMESVQFKLRHLHVYIPKAALVEVIKMYLILCDLSYNLFFTVCLDFAVLNSILVIFFITFSILFVNLCLH